jgi:hypothetical protein
MPQNIIISSTPKHLQITPTMLTDFLVDPVLAAKVLLSLQFDAFQAAAFRLAWWVPNVIDESGFGTGKSIRLWALAQLRCMLMPDQWCYAYYQRFQSGKDIFWSKYDEPWAANPFFRAQLGHMDFEGDKDGKDNTKGPACYIQHFKNSSRTMMGAPGWLQNAIGQAGITISWALIDEWTKIETMGKKKGTGVERGASGELAGGIDQQVLGRLRRPSFNQFHPLWGNHVIFSATAESTNHPSQARVNSFQREIDKGNPDYAIVSFSFKDASNLKSHTGKPFRDQIIDWRAIQRMKAQFTRSHFKRECLGIRSRETAGWYSEEALEKCVATGVANKLEPEIGRSSMGQIGQIGQMGQTGETRFYFMGVDPAPARGTKSDDGALAVLRVRPKPGVQNPTANLSDWLCEYVWAYRLRGATTRQWSAFMHEKHRHFGFAGICMDAQGGGIWINDELILPRQLIGGVETDVVPIGSIEDMGRTGPNAQMLLTMYRRRDPGIKHMWPHLAGDDNLYEAMHLVFQEAVTYQVVSFPKPFNARPASETEGWHEEQRWALKDLDAARSQLQDIQVATNGDGTWLLTGNSAKQFSATGKKDLAYACIYAYVRFLVWLKMGELDFTGTGNDTSGGYYVMGN